jgi:hypothetical protein
MPTRPSRAERIRSGDAWFAAVCAYLDDKSRKGLLPAERFGPADPGMRADGVGIGIKRAHDSTPRRPFQMLFATARDARLVLMLLNDGDPDPQFAPLVAALVDALQGRWHPWPDHTVGFTGCKYLERRGLRGFLCVRPDAMWATGRVALQPRVPALRGATIVQLMAITGEERALALTDLDALLERFTRTGRNRMTVQPPFVAAD